MFDPYLEDFHRILSCEAWIYGYCQESLVAGMLFFSRKAMTRQFREKVYEAVLEIYTAQAANKRRRKLSRDKFLASLSFVSTTKTEAQALVSSGATKKEKKEIKSFEFYVRPNA